MPMNFKDKISLPCLPAKQFDIALNSNYLRRFTKVVGKSLGQSPNLNSCSKSLVQLSGESMGKMHQRL